MNRTRVLSAGLLVAVVLSAVVGVGTATPFHGSAPAGDDEASTDAPGQYSSWAADRLNASPALDGARDASTARSPASAAASTRLVSATDGVTFEATGDQVLRGETDLPPGSELVVVLVSQDPGEYLGYRTTEVDLDGTFRAEFDMSRLSSEHSLRVIVSHQGTELVDTTANVTAASDAADLDDRYGWIYLSPDHETIEGNTSLPTGTQVTVVVHSAGDTDFERRRTVTVDSRGSFSTAFDFGNLPHATKLRVSVFHDGTRLDYVPAKVFH